MSTALAISLFAVAISLFTVFIALRKADIKKAPVHDSDVGTAYNYDSGSTINSPAWTSDGGHRSVDDSQCNDSASGGWGDGGSTDSGSCDSGGGDGGGGGGGD